LPFTPSYDCVCARLLVHLVSSHPASPRYLCFSDSCGPPRDLHSFPTRRSSELACEEIRPPRLLSGDDLITLGHPPGPRLGEILRDRKSTRLNSSHEWISYAVFCLKKKKTTGLRRHSASTTQPNARLGMYRLRIR